MTRQRPGVDWSNERDQYREVALRELAKIGLTDIEQRIRWERAVTPADWEGSAGSYLGATFILTLSRLGFSTDTPPEPRVPERRSDPRSWPHAPTSSLR